MYTIRLGIWPTTIARHRSLRQARLHTARILATVQVEVHIDRDGRPVERWMHGVCYDLRKGGD